MDTIINTTATDNDVSNDIFDQYDNPVNTNTNNSQNSQEELVMNNQNNNAQAQNNNNQNKGKFHEEHPIIFGGLLVAGGAAVGATACYFISKKLNDPTCSNNTNAAFKVNGGIN